MKKFILFICVLLCLSGCKNINDTSIVNELDYVFENVLNVSKQRRNNIIDYYEYYLPSDMSEETLDFDSVVLRFNDSRIIMSPNISSIVNSVYYPSQQLKDDGFFKEENLLYSSTGDLPKNDELSRKYCYNLYKYNDQYVIHLFTNDMNYYGTTNLKDVSDLTKHLLTMAYNTIVKTDDIIANYGKKDVIDYQKKQINLFDKTMPENGELVAMLVDDAIVGDGVIISGRNDEQYNNGLYIEDADIVDPVGGQSFNEGDAVQPTKQ